MFDPKKLPTIMEETEMLKKQFGFLKGRLEAIEVNADRGYSKEDKERVLETMERTIKGVDEAIGRVRGFDNQDAIDSLNQLEKLEILSAVNEALLNIRSQVDKVAYDLSAYNLDRYKSEIFKPIEELHGIFEYITPNIRFEISAMEAYYRIPENSEGTVLPELNEILGMLESADITLRDFLDGFERGGKKYDGYNDLRTRGNLFSRYQIYEGDPIQYEGLNACIYQICKTLEAFFSEHRAEPELVKIFPQFEEINKLTSPSQSRKNITRMAEIFKNQSTFLHWMKIIGKKYSFREEYKKGHQLIEEFNSLAKKGISYNMKLMEADEKKFSAKFTGEEEKKKYTSIMEELNACVKEKALPFDRIDQVFKKLARKDFHVIVREKEVDDVTLAITPPLEEKYGGNNLKKVNLIIQEVNFWYPAEARQIKFGAVAHFTQKMQANEPIEEAEFWKLIDSLNKELNKIFRRNYDNVVRSLNTAMKIMGGIISNKAKREGLASRMLDKEMWNFYMPMLNRVNKNVAILHSNNPAITADNMNKFPFIKSALEEICQILYDLSMRLFILFDCGDRRSTVNMMNILSTFNEFHDLDSLIAVFNIYYKQKSIPNLFANEFKIKNATKNPFVKGKLKILFPREKRDAQGAAGAGIVISD